MIVDDHPLTRAGLTQLVNAQDDIEVCCEASTSAEAVEKVSCSRPDLVVTDITLPGRSGLELIKDLHAMHPELPVLVVTMHDELIHVDRALRAGARGYVMKEAGGEVVLEAIRKVLRGEVFLSPRAAEKVLNTFGRRTKTTSASAMDELSDRELQVYELIGRGKSTKEMAALLKLSPKTVEAHRGNLKNKLGLRGSALVRQAVCWVEMGDTGKRRGELYRRL